MKVCNTVKLTLLRHLQISKAAASALSDPSQPQETQVYSEMQSDQVCSRKTCNVAPPAAVPDRGSALPAKSTHAR